MICFDTFKIKYEEWLSKGRDDTMPKVSVLVPIYNVERYLPQCLDSLLAQTLQDIEIICIDDGSTDRSGAIADDYAAKDSRVHVIHKKNSGYGDSMNVGLSEASGEYIGILESDDFAEPDMFEILYEKGHANNAEIVKANYWEYNEQSGDHFIDVMSGLDDCAFFVPYERWQVFSTPASIWSGIYLRSFLNANEILFNTTPGASYQDTAFRLKAFSCAQRMSAVSRAFVHYRTDNAASSVNDAGKVYYVCGEFESYWSYLSQRPEIFDKVKEIVPYYQYIAYRWNYRRIAQSFKIDFLKRASEDFLSLRQKGLLRKCYWDQEAWEDLKELLLDPIRLYRCSALKAQRTDLWKSGFLQMLSRYPVRYVYGAGIVGQKTARFLVAQDISFDGFVVSPAAHAAESVMDKPVYGAESLQIDLKSTVFVIAVKEEDFDDILTTLHDTIGSTNVVLMERELRSHLGI